VSTPFPQHGPVPVQPPYPLPPQGPPPPQRTNGFATASLVLGILGVWLLSVIFGAVALGQIKRTGQAGRGMAIAGVVLSGIWALVTVVAIIAVAVNSAARDSSGTIAAPGDVSATELRVGDCLNGLENGSFTSLPAVPCASAHEGEVFAVFDLPAGPYPGESEVDSQAQDQCNLRIDVYSPSAVSDSNVGLFVVTPNAGTWPTGDREVVCIASAESGTTTGSIRDR
jgi:hypothetical protein